MEEHIFRRGSGNGICDLDSGHAVVSCLAQRTAHAYARVEEGVGVHAHRFHRGLGLEQCQGLPVNFDADLEVAHGLLGLELEAAAEGVPVVFECHPEHVLQHLPQLLVLGLPVAVQVQ